MGSSEGCSGFVGNSVRIRWITSVAVVVVVVVTMMMVVVVVVVESVRT